MRILYNTNAWLFHNESEGHFLLDDESFDHTREVCTFDGHLLSGPSRGTRYGYGGFNIDYFVIPGGVVETEERFVEHLSDFFRHDMLHIHYETNETLDEIERMLEIQEKVPFNLKAVEKMRRQEELKLAQKKMDELE